jgi:hypothetical protein
MSDVTHDTPKKGNPPANWRDVFIKALTTSGNVSWSARKAKVTREYAYRLRKEDEAFSAAWDDAIEQSSDAMEQEAWRRANKGVRRVKSFYHQGERVGEDVIVEYSDTLMMFLLKARRPDVYRERTDLNVKGNVSIGFTADEAAQAERELKTWEQERFSE